MDSEDKPVNFDHINDKLQWNKDKWKSHLEELDNKFVNYHINNKCTEKPETEKIVDVKKGTYTDWKYSKHFKLDHSNVIDRNKSAK